MGRVRGDDNWDVCHVKLELNACAAGPRCRCAAAYGEAAIHLVSRILIVVPFTVVVAGVVLLATSLFEAAVLGWFFALRLPRYCLSFCGAEFIARLTGPWGIRGVMGGGWLRFQGAV